MQELREREGVPGDREGDGLAVFCLRAMAMGDRNATVFGQSAHVQILRSGGALEPDCTLAYRRPWPRAPVAQGVMVDDQMTAAIVPLHARHGIATASEARRLFGATLFFGATLAAYSAAGAHDVPEKRQEDVATAVVWGCEVQGRAGRVGVARAKRAAIAAVTLAIALAGCSSVDLLRRVLGLWADVLLYRRDVFAVLGAAYHFTNRYAGDGPRAVRSLPAVACV